MKKAKQDAMETREEILKAAFKCFMENGYQDSSLALIANEADVTRGAVYWHFKDKSELYREVVHRTLKEADVVKIAYELPDNLTYKERLFEVFWFSQNENPKVDFIYKTLTIVSDREEFRDLHDAIQLEKIKLFRYFVEETRMHIRMSGLDVNEVEGAEYYASDLFLLFEGLFLTKNISVGIIRDKKHIEKYVELIISDLL